LSPPPIDNVYWEKVVRNVVKYQHVFPVAGLKTAAIWARHEPTV